MSSSGESPIRVSDDTAIYRNRNRCEVTIDQRDFEVIKEAMEIGNKRSRAAFSLGLLISSVIGALSVLSSADLTGPKGVNWWPVVCLLLLTGLALISATVAVHARLDATKSAKRPLLTQLLTRLESDFARHAVQRPIDQASNSSEHRTKKTGGKTIEQMLDELLGTTSTD